MRRVVPKIKNRRPKRFLRRISVGQQLARSNLRDDARDTIRAIIDFLSTHDWKARGSGGHPVKITENMTKVLPETAVEMAGTLIRYRLSPVARCYRTVAELSYLSYLAEWKRSFWRTPETQRGYVNILSKLIDLARTYPVVQFIMDKYNREKAEPFLDYYELSRSLNTEVNRMNMQLGIH